MLPTPLESLEKQQRQQQFRQRIASEHIIDFFNSPSDLTSKVVTSIFNWEYEQCSGVPTIDAKWAAIPHLPHPYLAHPYPLQDHFTGRIKERKMLCNWLGADRYNLLVLVGIGGMGKSALAWVWFHQDILHQVVPGIDQPELHLEIPEQKLPIGIFWWSFYESDATFAAFLDDALYYVSNGTISPARIPSLYTKAKMLITLLQQHRVLLILDGFERLLKAYAGLGGAYQGEEATAAPYSDPLSCADPLVARFLKWIASFPMCSRVLITSRLFPKDLEDSNGSPLAACQQRDLESLDLEDAITFFHAMGVQGTRFEIKTVCAPYGCHALTLRLLAGYIINHFTQPGDIKVALRFDPLGKLVPHQHNILDIAYGALTPAEQQLLSRMAAFRSPVSYTALQALHAFQSEIDLEEALRTLVKRSLISFERSRGTFDMHPILRRYSYERLIDKQAVHACIRDYYFAALPVTAYYPIHKVEDLSSIIEFFHHTIQAGLYEEAYHLYVDRLNRELDTLGAFQIEVALLEGFLQKGKEFDLSLKDIEQQKIILSQLGIALGFLGQTRRALTFLQTRVRLEATSKNDDESGTINTIGNIAFFKMRLGDLAGAENDQRQSIVHAEKSHDTVAQAYGYMRLGLIFTYTGRFDEAREALSISHSVFNRLRNKGGESILWNYRTIRARLMGDFSLAMVCSRRALRLATSSSEERQIVRSKNSLAAVLLDIARERSEERRNRFLTEAELLLTEALTRCRQSDLVELEASILLNWARWHRFEGDLQLTKSMAEQALDIATRCEYRLEQAEIYNFLGRLAFEEGNNNQTYQYAQQAIEHAQCDISLYCYRNALEEAQHLLQLIGP